MINSKKWQHCCVAHDVAYWRGGTAAQREQADSALSSLELGDEAHFTDALVSMPDDYPDGDMLAETRAGLLHTHMAKAGTVGRVAARTVAHPPRTVHTFHGHVLEGYFSQH